MRWGWKAHASFPVNLQKRGLILRKRRYKKNIIADFWAGDCTKFQ